MLLWYLSIWNIQYVTNQAHIVCQVFTWSGLEFVVLKICLGHD